MRLKKCAAAFLMFFVLVSCLPLSVLAEETAPIKLYIDQVEQKLEHPCTIDQNGNVYIPMEEVFFKMGVYMSWNEMGGFWYGEGNNGEIRITVGSMTADIDWVDVELPAPIIEENGVVMIPIYLVEDALKTEPAVYNAAEKSIYIQFPDINYQPQEEFKIESVVGDLPEGVDLFREEQLYQLYPDTGGESIVYSVVDVEGMPFKKAAQLEMLPVEPFPLTIYSNQYATIIDGGDFEAGDVGLMTFWARATETTDETGLAKFRPAYEQLQFWQKAQADTVDIGKEWKKYYLPLYSGQYTLKSGASHLTFSVGGKAQTIQIADMHLYNYGKQVPIEMLIPGTGEAYKGMEDDALWRKEAYRRIEKYRKNDMIITVKDEEGNPVEGATVRADMTENEFMLGLAICSNEILDLNEEESRVGQIKSDVIDLYSNTGVCGLEMKGYRSIDDYRSAVRMVNEWLDRGKRMRGHCLTWDDQAIRDMDGYPNVSYEEMYEYLKEEVIGEAWLFKGTMTQWDGLNEPHDSNGMRLKYGTEMFSDMLQIAKAIDPKSKIYVNETGMEGHPNRDEAMRAPALLQIVEGMVENERAPVDGLGVQGHCTRYLYPQGFYQELDTLAQEVDEVSVTEYDFFNTDYTYAPQHLRDTFIATFSHPKATAFVIWGYYDPMHWRNYGPFYDRNWNKKPELDEWDRLIHEEFATHATAVTDQNGQAVIRGYRGKYNVSVAMGEVNGSTEFTLTNSQTPERDNYIHVVMKQDSVEMTHPNPVEVYADNNSSGRVEFNNWTEAYADYIATVGDKELIGVYDHSDNHGNSVPKTNDGLYNTYWYGQGNDFLTYELVKKADRGTVSVDFRTPCGEVYDYRVMSSKDGETWTTLYEGSSDTKASIDFTDAMFIRIQSVDNEYMGVSEVNIYAEKD
ncbi:endo-1,4-beta-xylanase [Ructibacterium gallinarum]|uniref:endo-1,4-beta-xylanase n=1 Tax=Ructibacterium gallinarum TaxID=2779355 RepID=A0A9D5LZ46_9FIRM|nr:endo-1,4-beta-xylanase [Ructibacterium gallinarum]MBE5039156.1 endo-1,4-beta-xylanase [Ructibacterium gallinarum]